MLSTIKYLYLYTLVEKLILSGNSIENTNKQCLGTWNIGH